LNSINILNNNAYIFIFHHPAHGNTATAVALAQGSVVLFAIVTPTIHIIVMLLAWVLPIKYDYVGLI
jgi:hypothetical protein